MSEEAIDQQDEAAVAPVDDSADGQGAAAENVAQAFVEESTATAELLLQDGGATEQIQDVVSTSDAQVTPSTSSTVALPELDSAAQSHVDTEATEGALSMPVFESFAEIAQQASVLVADVDALAASREPEEPIDEVEANQTLRAISQQRQGQEQQQQLTLDVVIDDSSTAQAPDTAPAMSYAEYASTDVNNTVRVIIEPSAAEVVSTAVTHADAQCSKVDIGEIEGVQPAMSLASTVEDVPSTSSPSLEVIFCTPLTIFETIHSTMIAVAHLSEACDHVAD
jgi:hypothetical protein